MVGRRMAETSINEIVVASPIPPPRAPTSQPPPTSYSIGFPHLTPFSPSSTYVAFLKSSPRYRRRVDEIGTLIKLLLGAVEQPRLAASKRQPADRMYDGNGSTATTIHSAPFNRADINHPRRAAPEPKSLELFPFAGTGLFLAFFHQSTALDPKI